MKRIIFLITTLIMGLIFINSPDTSLAAEFSCPLTVTTEGEALPKTFNYSFGVTGDEINELLKTLPSNGKLMVNIERGGAGVDCRQDLSYSISNIAGRRTIADSFQIEPWQTTCHFIFNPGNHVVRLLYSYSWTDAVELCKDSYTNAGPTFQCAVTGTATGNQDADDDTWQVNVNNITGENIDPSVEYQVKTIASNGNDEITINEFTSIGAELLDGEILPQYISRNQFFDRSGEYTLSVYFRMPGVTNSTEYDLACTNKFTILERGKPTPTPSKAPSNSCQIAIFNGEPIAQVCAVPECRNHPACTGETPEPIPENPELRKICESIPSSQASRQICEDCVEDGDKAYTALGCLSTDIPTFFKENLFTFGLGLAGGIAFLLMLWGGFNILISQGDAHKIQEGREIIFSAGIGLVFIIFAIVILQIIGRDILGLPFIGPESP